MHADQVLQCRMLEEAQVKACESLLVDFSLDLRLKGSFRFVEYQVEQKGEFKWVQGNMWIEELREYMLHELFFAVSE